MSSQKELKKHEKTIKKEGNLSIKGRMENNSIIKSEKKETTRKCACYFMDP